MSGHTQRPTQAEINQALLSTDHLLGDIGARTRQGGAIALAAHVLRIALQLLGTAILARLLAPEDFGLVAMGATVMAFIAVFTDLYMSSATIQRKELDQDTVSALLLLNVTLGIATVLIATAAAPAATLVFKDDRLPLVVVGLSGSVPVAALASQHNALLVRNMRWMRSQLIQLAGMAAGLVAAVISAWVLNLGYWSLIVNAWATAIVTAALAWTVCPWRPSWVRDWTGARSSIRFGLNLTGAMILNYVHRQLDNVLIGWRWGSAELGYYSRAYNLLLTPLNFVNGPVSTAMVPALSRLQTDPDRWRKAYLDGLAVVAMVGGLIAALMFGGAEPIITVVFGPGWEPAQRIFANLVICMLAATPMATSGWIYISLGRTHRMLIWGFIGVPMYVAAFIIGLPYGAAGVALCYSISQLLAFTPCMFMATRDTKVTMIDVCVTIAAPTIAAIGIGGALDFATDQLPLFYDLAAMCVAGAVFCLVMLAAILWLPSYQRLREVMMRYLRAALERLPLRPPAGGPESNSTNAT